MVSTSLIKSLIAVAAVEGLKMDLGLQKRTPSTQSDKSARESEQMGRPEVTPAINCSMMTKLVRIAKRIKPRTQKAKRTVRTQVVEKAVRLLEKTQEIHWKDNSSCSVPCAKWRDPLSFTAGYVEKIYDDLKKDNETVDAVMVQMKAVERSRSVSPWCVVLHVCCALGVLLLAVGVFVLYNVILAFFSFFVFSLVAYACNSWMECHHKHHMAGWRKRRHVDKSHGMSMLRRK